MREYPKFPDPRRIACDTGLSALLGVSRRRRAGEVRCARPSDHLVPFFRKKPVAQHLDHLDFAELHSPAETALPHHCDAPAHRQLRSLRAAVAFDVAGDLGCPEGAILLRQAEQIAIVTVKKAAPNIDQRPVLREDEVRPPRQVLRVEPVTEAASMQTASNYSLGLSVLPSDRRHVSAARLAVVDVRQLLPPVRLHPPLLQYEAP